MANNISIDNSTLTFNGTIITGFSEDSDALTFPEIELAQEKYGADGQMTVANTGTKGGRVTIKLLATSQSCIYLSSICEQVKRGASAVFNGSFVNHTTGSSVTLTRGVLVTYHPYATIGKAEVSSMQYIIAFESVDGVLTSADFS